LKKEIKIFISYSHDSLNHKHRVLELANKLREEGINCLIDQYEESPEEGWLKWMELNIATSAYILVVCTKAYYDKFNSSIEGGKGVKWEGAIISQEIYDNEGKNRRFIPVVFDELDIPFIPRILKDSTHYNILDASRYECLYRRLTKQPAVKKPPVGNVIKFPPKSITSPDYKKHRKSKESSVTQIIEGNDNFQISNINGNILIHSPSAPRITRLSVDGTIGSKPLLKQAIKERFNKLGEERAKRFGKSSYAVMYKNFKTAFEIKNGAWTGIWDWPEATADAIIKYLDDKYSNTIAGRNKTAIEKGTLIPSKGHLHEREKELLSQIDLEISSPQVKDALLKYFGVTSHTKLSRQKHWQWVLSLEKRVQEIIGE
jgi:hypothetical protein